MFYRESGQFKTTYQSDQALFPIAQDRWFIIAIGVFMFLIMPFIISDYWANALVLPFLIYGLAAIGLNILTGYCGQLSLGTGAFLAVGAYAAYKLTTAFPELNLIIIMLISGGITAGVGILFGIPSLRIKGFYLAVATLAAQFFILWLFNKAPWFYNYSATGQITMPEREMFGIIITGPNATPTATYMFTLFVVVGFTLLAKNLVRGKVGRGWMAIRDMDIAAEIIGIAPLKTKLTAFAVSSFFVGVAGALLFAVWLGSAEASEAFGIDQSFLILFMIIIGGLGSIKGSFMGAAFMTVMPIFLKNVMVDGFGFSTAFAEHVQLIIMGSLIIFFLIVEPHGLARLWQITREKLRIWPFPH